MATTESEIAETSPSTSPSQLPDDAEWIRSLKTDAQPTTFKKGKEYAESRRVTQLLRTGDKVSGTVIGTEGMRYEVELWPENGKTASRCTCPAHNQYGPHCKHVVAAGLLYRARMKAAALRLHAQKRQAEAAAAAAAEAGQAGAEGTDDGLDPPGSPVSASISGNSGFTPRQRSGLYGVAQPPSRFSKGITS